MGIKANKEGNIPNRTKPTSGEIMVPRWMRGGEMMQAFGWRNNDEAEGRGSEAAGGRARTSHHQPTGSSGEGELQIAMAMSLTRLLCSVFGMSGERKRQRKGEKKKRTDTGQRAELTGLLENPSGPDKKLRASKGQKEKEHESRDRDRTAQKTIESQLFSSV